MEKQNKKKGIGGHQSAKSETTSWITPLPIIQALGHFDLDPATPEVMPWQTAANRYTEKENGLIQPWHGRVWLNPPYDDLEVWLHRLANHGEGTALTFARTETKAFFSQVWDRCNGVLFIKNRLWFHRPDGSRAASNGGAPSVLIAYGQRDAEILEGCNIPGQYLPVNYRHVVVVGISPSWFAVVSIAVRSHGDTDLQPVYEMVERIAPDKVAKNQFWKEKVRQKVQVYRRKNAPAPATQELF